MIKNNGFCLKIFLKDLPEDTVFSLIIKGMGIVLSGVIKSGQNVFISGEDTSDNEQAIQRMDREIGAKTAHIFIKYAPNPWTI